MTGKHWALLIGALLLPFSGFILLLVLVAAVMGASMSAHAGQAAQPGTVSSVAGIPPVLLGAYNGAVANLPKLRPNCAGMTWSLLAAIGEVESNQAGGSSIASNGDISPPIYGPALNGSGVGGNTTPMYNATDAEKQLAGGSAYARAVGPMQFMPATWISDGQDGNGDGARNPQNVFDAALTTAAYLCGTGSADLGKGDQLRSAILRYNHSQAYVDQVLGWKATYDQMGQNAGNAPVPASSARGQAVVAAAQREMAQNIPYSWGGGGTAGPSLGFCDETNGYLNGACSASHTVGFDCSGLSQYAYGQAGVNIARTAQEQYDGAPTKVPRSAGLAALQVGDLVFFSLNPAASGQGIYHVGIYVGGGQMINAAHTGTNVRTEPVWLNSYTGGGRY
ncbi:C40 family peptidase [Streptomyces sp. TLI_171]|uniref:C40 family peptidase n=1 Tax=Streptomyces sp. TLI_171 TaxID=1938859 RepID=UPI000C180173|nr:bifunctional lytic transglycosylase/C40 family peptidase [Streptomyces sp. TLI_171]RKE03022.1 transglycosylase protein with SLT domain [Streptomyces sp. TLI_171]